ncbi:hypothetical protein ACTXG6_40400 [Pseudonocardia sp. Cha107L01]|uniref:hypothetical protein n=1 Tax=Pseudonocardia sp. Cha107L01 TaxID=3457576 RepID=UPI00403E8009
MSTSPTWLSARLRVAGLKRFRAPDDPALVEAERVLAATPREAPEPWVTARARLAALKKHREPGDPAIEQAERDMKLAYREYRIRCLAEELLASAPEAVGR